MICASLSNSAGPNPKRVISFTPIRSAPEAVNPSSTRAFPGSVSNHHLGTQLGLLMAAYEMNQFKDEYQKAVVNNAKT